MRFSTAAKKINDAITQSGIPSEQLSVNFIFEIENNPKRQSQKNNSADNWEDILKGALKRKAVRSVTIHLLHNEMILKESQYVISPKKTIETTAPQSNEHQLYGLPNLGDISGIVKFELDKRDNAARIQSLEADNKELKQDIIEKDLIIEMYEKRDHKLENAGFVIRALKELNLDKVAGKLQGLLGLDDSDIKASLPPHEQEPANANNSDNEWMKDRKAELCSFINEINELSQLKRMYWMLSSIQEKPDLVQTINELIAPEGEKHLIPK